MTNRTPQTKDLAALSRDNWEQLCSEICTIVFQVKRVEDRLGKGNGMDGWRSTINGIEGFQYRRFDDRFNDLQARKIKQNIALAVSKCQLELSSDIIRYYVLFNIDLEPGHGLEKGEIKRWDELKTWALKTHKLELIDHGVTWVLTQLKKYPYLYPSLFEDINKSVIESRDAITSKLDDSVEILLAELRKRVEESPIEIRLKKILALLAREAQTHLKRGLDHEKAEEYALAIEKLENAKRLIELEKIDDRMHGQILLVLCGVMVYMGRLADALTNGKLAVDLLLATNDIALYRFARGNVAMALTLLQKYPEARLELEKLLSEFENEGDLVEIVRTLQNLTELAVNEQNMVSAFTWGERLRISVDALIKARGGVDKLTIASFGTAGNVFTIFAPHIPDPVLRQERLRRGCELLEYVERMAPEVKSPLLAIRARGARAQALWFLNDLDDAAKLFGKVILEADAFHLEKIAADAQFNCGLIQRERRELEIGNKLLLNARERYVKIGDFPSVADVDKILRR